MQQKIKATANIGKSDSSQILEHKDQEITQLNTTLDEVK